jgi:hypothetical protein
MSVTQQEPTAKTRNQVFINYRREETSGYAGHLHERLCKRFGHEQVFMDLKDIPPGTLFPEYIKEKVASCAAVLVVIGREWLTCSAAGRRRLDDPEDFVRIEVATALSDAETLVIPVLVGGAVMPRENDLPDVLKPLAIRQASELSDKHWKSDTRLLLEALEAVLPPLHEDDNPPPPPPPPRFRRLGGYWKLFTVRLLAAVLLLSVALAAQVRVAYRPVPVSLEATGRFSPAAVKLSDEVLTIEAPQADAEGLLLAHVANADEVVDLVCENARLDGNTLMLFSEQNPPTSPSRVDFLTTRPNAPAAGEPCRTFIQVRAADPGRPPSALRFYQQGAPGGDILRALELKADGEVLVGVDTVMAEGSAESSPGCEKLLRVAPRFHSPVSGDSTISVVAGAASAASFTFSPTTAKESLFVGAGGLFQPFSFGEVGTLRARAVEVNAPRGGGAAPAPVLAARSVDGGEPLSVESLLVGSDHLEVKVSGVGFVKVNGVDFADPLGRISRHPFLSLLLVVADAALLAWIIRLLFGRRRPLA